MSRQTGDESTVSNVGERESRAAFPVVQLAKADGSLCLTIGGQRHLPLIFAFARTHYVARNTPGFDYVNDVVYEQLRRVYEAGIRIFHPCMPEIGYGRDGEFDYGHFDTVMRRLAETLPEAWFVLRVIIPPPPLPKDEQILVARRPGDTSDAKACQVFDQISLFSETYRDYAPGAMARIMEHLAALPEAGRIVGTVICGAGFEWNWGNPGGGWGTMMDTCPAVTREFGRFLERKYGTVVALRAAWNRPDVDFAAPPLPGLEDRTHSDLGGFRDPSQPFSRWTQDFLDCYNDRPTAVLTPIFDRLTQTGPPLFHGVFHLATMNTAFCGVQTMPGVFEPVLDHPAIGFVTNCLTYGDRKAGGVSIYMNTAIRSHALHGKLAIGEADIRPSTIPDVWNEASLDDAIQSMRREFAAMLLCQRQGIWYFDMTGGWFDQPRLLEELSRQARVGRALLDEPHTSVSETLVVLENRSWKYFGLADHKLALKTIWSGGNQQLLSDMTQANIEALMRLGAPVDTVVAEDFLHADLGDYTLLVFPFSFLCEPDMRAEIHRRVEAGATALFLYAAGIVDGETASLDNVERLVGMRVRVGAPAPLAAALDPAVARGPGIDAAARSIGNPETHHFRYVIDDSRAAPLAHYADGAVAAAMMERGRGRVILSAVPAASVPLYKLVAKLAGVHLYSEAQDALYASGEFLVVHTGDGGPRHFRLPRVVPQVTEIFSGRVVAINAREITADLPARTTVVYRLGA